MSISKIYAEKFGVDLTKNNPKACEHCEPEDMQGTGNFSMDVYKEHLRRRQILIIGPIDDSMVEKVSLQILNFNEDDEERTMFDRMYDRMNNPITLKIASPGGLVDPGLGIISQITQSETPVIGYGIGDCSSMGALILASCHARFISLFSRIMIHSLSSGTGGKLYEILDKADEVTRVQEILDNILTSRTLITQKQLDQLHARREDWYMSSDEAVKFGVVDEVMPVGLKMRNPKQRAKQQKKENKK